MPLTDDIKSNIQQVLNAIPSIPNQAKQYLEEMSDGSVGVQLSPNQKINWTYLQKLAPHSTDHNQAEEHGERYPREARDESSSSSLTETPHGDSQYSSSFDVSQSINTRHPLPRTAKSKRSQNSQNNSSGEGSETDGSTTDDDGQDPSSNFSSSQINIEKVVKVGSRIYEGARQPCYLVKLVGSEKTRWVPKTEVCLVF